MSITRQLLSSSSRTTPDPLTGTLTVRFDAQQADLLVYRLSIETAGGAPASSLCEVHVGMDASAGSYRDVAYFGAKDSADWPNGLLVPVGMQLILVWYDTTNGITSPANITAATASAVAHAEVEF